MKEYQYLWKFSDDQKEIIIDIYDDTGKHVSAPRYPIEQFDSKGAIEAFIKGLEATRQLALAEAKLNEARLNAERAARLEAIGTPPTKAAKVNVEDSVLDALKENIISDAINTGTSLEDVKQEYVDSLASSDTPFDPSKVSFSREDLARVEKAKEVEVDPA